MDIASKVVRKLIFSVMINKIHQTNNLNIRNGVKNNLQCSNPKSENS
ncbi:hypothetical protein LSO9J_50045 [Candidatus Liberibacter solanacearum]